MANKVKEIIFFALGAVVSVVPVALATVSYFPLWIHLGADATLSGISFILLAVSAIPLFKMIKAFLKSPAAWGIWLLIFILFFMLSKIANELTVISFIGFISNAIGALLFKISKKYKADKK